jgi:Protein of unknown function (DUF3489)
MNDTGTNKMRRTTFTIHPDHRVAVFTRKSKHPSRDGSIEFSSERELGKLAANWPGSRLVEIWNELPNVKRVTRFTDRKIAVRRIWAALQQLARPDRESAATGGPDGGTKAECVVALLKGPSGASLRAIMDLTGWQSHSVRGFISAQLSKRMGFRIQSFKRDGERIYRIPS